MSVIKGENAILYWKVDGYYKPVACMVSCNLTTNTELRETSTTQTGTSRTYRGNRNTWSVSCQGLVSFDTNIPHVKLRQLQQSFTVIPISWTATDDNGITENFSGNVIITNISNDASANDFYQYSIEATGTGDYTITDIPVDPNECCQDAWIYYTGNGTENFAITISTLMGRQIAGRIYRDGIEYRPSGADHDGTGTPVGKQFKFDITSGKISFDTNLPKIAIGEQIDIPYNLCVSLASCDIVVNNVVPSVIDVEGGTDSTLEISQQGSIDAANKYFTLKGVPVVGDSVKVNFSLDQLTGVDEPYFNIVSQSNPALNWYKAFFNGNGSEHFELTVSGNFDGTDFSVNSSGFADTGDLLDDVISKLNDAGVTTLRDDEDGNIGLFITATTSITASSVVSIVGLDVDTNEVTSTLGSGQTLDDLINDLLTKIQAIDPAATLYTDTDGKKGVKITGATTVTINSITITQAPGHTQKFQITFLPTVNNVPTAPDNVRVRYSTDNGTTWTVVNDFTYDPDTNYQLVIVNDNIDTTQTYLWEVTPVCNGTFGTPGTGFIVCIAVTIPSFSLPDAVVGQLYDEEIPLSGTGPFTLSDKVNPSWITTFEIDGDNVHISGTPTSDDVTESTTISFKAHNCNNKSADYSDTISVALSDTKWLPTVIVSGDSLTDYEQKRIQGTPDATVTVTVSSYVNVNGGTLKVNGTTVTAVGDTFEFTLDAMGFSSVIDFHIDGVSNPSSAILGKFDITSTTAGSIGSPSSYSISKVF